MQDRAPALGVGRGALFGLGLFLLQDELVNAATGLSARPRQYPWQAHARGLIAHIVYGVVTDPLLRVLKGSDRSTRYTHDEQAPFRISRPAEEARYDEDQPFDDQRHAPPSRPYPTEESRGASSIH
jgi:hypothetical protein